MLCGPLLRMTSRTSDEFRTHVKSYVFATLIPAAFSFATIVVLLRAFGADTYGRYSVLQATALTVSSYASGWLTQSVLRFAARWRNEDRVEEHMRTVRALSIASAALSCIAGIIIAASAGNRVSILVVVALLCFFMALYRLAYASAQASLLHARITRVEGFRALTAFAGPLVLYVLHVRSVAALLGTLVVAFAVALPFLEQRIRGAMHMDRAIARSLWSFGWPMAMWLGSSQVLLYSDRALIAHYDGYAAAGVYSATADFVRRAFMLALAPITLAAHPLIMEMMSKRSYAAVRALLRRSIRLQVVIAAAGLILLTTVGAQLLRRTMNIEDSHLLLPFGIGAALWSISLLAHKPLEATNNTRRMLACMAIAVVVNIFLNILFLPRWGYHAAAWNYAGCALCYLMLVSWDGAGRVREDMEEIPCKLQPPSRFSW
jgi:O-antigen/teichoic acid export membrane protein